MGCTLTQKNMLKKLDLFSGSEKKKKWLHTQVFQTSCALVVVMICELLMFGVLIL